MHIRVPKLVFSLLINTNLLNSSYHIKFQTTTVANPTYFNKEREGYTLLEIKNLKQMMSSHCFDIFLRYKPKRPNVLSKTYLSFKNWISKSKKNGIVQSPDHGLGRDELSTDIASAPSFELIYKEANDIPLAKAYLVN